MSLQLLVVAGPDKGRAFTLQAGPDQVRHPVRKAKLLQLGLDVLGRLPLLVDLPAVGHHRQVEGVLAIDATPNAGTLWFQASVDVSVNDGRLTITTSVAVRGRMDQASSRTSTPFSGTSRPTYRTSGPAPRRGKWDSKRPSI